MCIYMYMYVCVCIYMFIICVFSFPQVKDNVRVQLLCDYVHM